MEANNSQQASPTPMQPSDIPQPGKKKLPGYYVRVLRRIWLMVGTIAIFVCVGAIIGWSLNLYSIQNTKMVNGHTVQSYEVCTQAAAQYKTIISAQVRDAAEIKSMNDNLVQEAKQVQSIANYQEDPTCLAIVFNGAAIANDINTAQDAVNKIEVLADGGRFVDTRFVGIASIPQMKTRVDSMRNNNKVSGCWKTCS